MRPRSAPFRSGSPWPCGTAEPGQQGWNRDIETELRGDQRFGNTRGERLGVTGAEDGDQFEGLDHAGDGTEQTEKRSGAGREGDEGEETLEFRLGRQQSLVEDFLEQFLLLVGMIDAGNQKIAEGTGNARCLGQGLILFAPVEVVEDGLEIAGLSGA